MDAGAGTFHCPSLRSAPVKWIPQNGIIGDRSRRVYTIRETDSRFLIHVLPDGFHHIRYYGFLGDCHRGRKLAHRREPLGMAPPGMAQVRRGLDLIGETMATLEATTVPPATSAALKVARLLGELGTYVCGRSPRLCGRSRFICPAKPAGKPALRSAPA